MCGIAGIILSEIGGIGECEVQMLDGCQHRGPDSTGFAMYHGHESDVLICRIYLRQPGDAPEAKERAVKVHAVIDAHGGKVVHEEFIREHLRLEIQFDGDVKPLCYAIENQAGVEILSMGHKLEIIKGVGSAFTVDKEYGVARFRGTHGVGHVRLATESVVDVSRAHPFWAYGFNDVAIVHNGQITNYFKMRRRLVARGYQFRTDNDSELIAVYLADKLNKGRTLDEVLEESVHELDGTFSFLVSTADSIGFAKDVLAAKPMVVLERDGLVAVASEEVSLSRLFPGEPLATYEPYPGTFKTWRLSTHTNIAA
jgi:glutamate synthase domain-containing protein 1